MGSFYEDFQGELARWEKRYAGRPRDELLRIAFLSLEREQLVSVTYHDDLLSKRLAALPIDADTREILRHALAFTWKDEEMHAVYVRGLLWREGGGWVRARANWHFVAGLIAGWATFVQQHVRWREAPISRAIATATLWGGLLTGTAPPSVRQHLRYHSFREFCAFNVDAERTATLSWARLAALGLAAGLAASTVALFERIRDDEVLHERLFALLAEVLGPDDALAPGVSAATLAARIGALHPGLLPRDRRGEPAGDAPAPETGGEGAAEDQPLGAGGRVAVITGAGSREEGISRAVEVAGLGEVLRARAAALGKPVSALRVAVKTSFMLGVHRGDRSTIVAPEAMAALAAALRGIGVGSIAALEAPSVYDRFHTRRGVAEVAAFWGFDGDYDVVDAAADRVPADFPRGLVPATVSATWRDADVRIVLGKLRSHPVQIVMLGLATLDGLAVRTDSLYFPDRAAAPEVARATLAAAYPPHFSVIDGWDECPDGPAGMLGAARPRAPRRCYAGRDALAVDLVAARHLDVRDPYASPALRTAIHWFGDPRGRTEVAGTDDPVAGWRPPYRHGLATAWMFFAAFVYAHASRRGALFVPCVDERAFPPVARPGPMLRLGRRVVRWSFGLPTLEAAP